MKRSLSIVAARVAERSCLVPARLPRRVGVLLAILAALLPAGRSAAQPADPPPLIRVVMDNNYPPYVFLDDAGNPEGITIDQWRSWEQNTGTKVEIHAMDWGEALRRMRAGEFDVIDTIFKTEARSADFDFTEPYARIKVPIFFRRDIAGITDLASLKGFPVAAKEGDTAVDLLRQNGVTSLLLFSNYEAIITAAREHRVNVFVVDEPPAVYFLNKLGIADDFHMTAPVNIGEFHRAVRKNNPALLRWLAAGFASLTPAELSRIDEKWHGESLGLGPYVRWFGYAALGVATLLAVLFGWSWTLARQVRERTRELSENQALLQGVVDNSPSLIFIKDLAGKYLLTSQPARFPLALSQGNLLGKTDFDLFPRELAERYRRDDQAVVASGTPRMLEETSPHTDGPHDYLTIKFPLRDKDGRIFAVAGIATDITERKRAETALRELAELYRRAITGVGAVTYDYDYQTHTYGFMSPEIAGLTGYRPEEFCPGRWQKIIQECVMLGESAGLNQAEASQRVMRGEIREWRADIRILTRDGKTRWLADASVQKHDAAGRVTGSTGILMDITERKQTEAVLREKEQRLSDSQRIAHIGSWMVDLAGRRTWSAEAYRIYGVSPDAPAPEAEAFSKLIHPDDRPALQAWFRSCLAGEPPGELEYRAVRADGTVRFLSGHGELVRDAANRPLYAAGTVQDITEHRQAERHIQRLNRVYAVLSDINQTIVRERDPQAILAAVCRIAVDAGRFRMAWVARFNPATEELKPVASSGAVDGYLEWLRLDLQDPAQPVGPTEACLRSGTHAVCNDIARDPGYAPWRDEALRRGYQSSGAFPLQAGGRVMGVLNLYAGEPGFFDAEELRLLDQLAADISFALEASRQDAERQAAEAVRDALLDLQLQLSTARVPLELARSIFHAADRLWPVDAGTLNIYLREQDLMQSVLNFDVIGGRRQDVRLIEIVGKPTARIRRIMQHGGELVLRPPPFLPAPENVMFGDRSRPSASLMHVPIRWQGQAVGILSVQSYTPNAFTEEDLRTLQGLADHCGGVLERIRADAALRASEERFQELAGNINEVFWINDPASQKLIYVSPAYEAIWGRRCASLHAAPHIWVDSIHPDDREQIAAASATKPAQGAYDETYRILRPDGTVRWIHDRAFPVRGAAGEVLRIVGTAEDITQRRQLEEQLRQSQKMEAIGQLAGGVAHDFNNILASVLMQIELAGDEPDLPATVRESIHGIKADTERAANLTRQLLAFSRRQVMQTRSLDLNECVTGLAKMLQRILGEDVRLQLDLHPRALPTRADAGMLDQMLLNLVVNARDAMPHGGQLVIATNAKLFTPAETARNPDLAPGRYVCLRVTDTGCGMAPEILARLFEPFFTTKEIGKGTGLGLATVFGIVKQHAGWITVESALMQGTTFRIFLPATDAAEEPPAAPTPKPPPRGGTETILLVEDEPSVRTLTRIVLERSGYRVLEAANGPEALKVWAEHPGEIELLFTDLVMPEGLNGHDLASLLQADRPELRIIFTSGYSAEIAGRDFALQTGQHFIQKPASPQQIREIVRQCLDA